MSDKEKISLFIDLITQYGYIKSANDSYVYKNQCILFDFEINRCYLYIDKMYVCTIDLDLNIKKFKILLRKKKIDKLCKML